MNEETAQKILSLFWDRKELIHILRKAKEHEKVTIGVPRPVVNQALFASRNFDLYLASVGIVPMIRAVEQKLADLGAEFEPFEESA